MWANILSGSLLTKVLLQNKGSAIFIFFNGMFCSRDKLAGWSIFSALGVWYVFQQLQHHTDLISYSVITKYISDLRYCKGIWNTKHLVNWNISRINSGLFRHFPSFTSYVNCLRINLLQNCGSKYKIQGKLQKSKASYSTVSYFSSSFAKASEASPTECTLPTAPLRTKPVSVAFLPCSGEVSASNIEC